MGIYGVCFFEKLPKLFMIGTKNKVVPQGGIVNATISQEASGNYYVSLCCTDVEIVPLGKTINQVGIDLRNKKFCIPSEEESIANPHYLKKSLDKLANLQKELSQK